MHLPSNFGNVNIGGLQHKGAISIDGLPYFVKLDTLNPTVNGQWENNYNTQYSSISECLASCITRNIVNPHFQSVDYQFQVFRLSDQIITGTVSSNYLEEGEIEIIFGASRTSNYNMLYNSETWDELIYSKTPEERLENLARMYEENGVNYDEAKTFLVQQTVLDHLLGNRDRLSNPSNFVIAKHVNGTARPINMDFGRTLQYFWTKESEQNYQLEWLTEDTEDFVRTILNTDDSILSIANQPKKSRRDYMRNYDYKPIILNYKQAFDDIDTVIETVRTQYSELLNFTQVKGMGLKALLQTDYFKSYIEEGV